MKIKSHTDKQGPCGFFCFKYWLGKGCDDCVDFKKCKNKNGK